MIRAEKLNILVQIGSNHFNKVNSLLYILPNRSPEYSNKNEDWLQIGEKYVKFKLIISHLFMCLHLLVKYFQIFFRSW